MISTKCNEKGCDKESKWQILWTEYPKFEFKDFCDEHIVKYEDTLND